MDSRLYIAIDLKSFYASVECVERGLDPLTTHLVVADPERTEKTICLAVSPSLKAYGIPGRARLFEVVQAVRAVNTERLRHAPDGRFTGRATDAGLLADNPSLAIDYLVAPPQMARYMQVSTQIYQLYLRYFAPEDIHVYSIDEVMIDITGYLQTYRLSARDLAARLIRAVLAETGITAAAGIGTNLYLCKVAMDISAKHASSSDGLPIAELDEIRYRRTLWTHRPLTDFWRVGHGYARKLAEVGLYTMGDIARCSLGGPEDYYNEELLYRLFGVNAELLIDHAWGVEPCTMADIKAYRPEAASVGSGQVLSAPYPAAQARLVLREMADQLALDLLAARQVTRQLVLTVGYDIENLHSAERRAAYSGPTVQDPYGRRIPKPAHGTQNLSAFTSSASELIQAASELFDRLVDPSLLVRRLYLTANHVEAEDRATAVSQLDLFTDAETEKARLRERRLQETALSLKKKFGKNAILKGMNLEEGATARTRNNQIGGHKA